MGMGEPLEFSFRNNTFIFVEFKANLTQNSFKQIPIKQQDKIQQYASFFADISILTGYSKKSAGSRGNVNLRS